MRNNVLSRTAALLATMSSTNEATAARGTVKKAVNTKKKYTPEQYLEALRYRAAMSARRSSFAASPTRKNKAQFPRNFPPAGRSGKKGERVERKAACK